jgi:WD40 repeat protein
VSVDSEQGWRFRGRTAALSRIVDWLERPQPDRRVLVVTGSPGAGKSAVLGRVVTTADSAVRASLPPDDETVKAPEGSVGCAVHAKGKTALEVAAEIARAAPAALPEQAEDFAPALRDALSSRGRRFNVIIDALDEAASPAEARAVVTKVIAPMIETCADVGAQVVVGSRRADGDGDLLGTFGGAARLVDLDDTEFFAGDDLTAYALATLQLAGHERAGNPYADNTVAGPVAGRIAELSEQNFLVAGLTARTHGLYDDTPVDPALLSFSPKVADAMREYLRRIPLVTADAPANASCVSAETLLSALAFAEAPGLPASLWRTALRALGAGDVHEGALTRFARSSAASFLVESSEDGEQYENFRLFHQALNDALLGSRTAAAGRAEDEQALTRAFLRFGQERNWTGVPPYLLRFLPVHASRARLTDDLLADDAYLLHADLRRVLQNAKAPVTPSGQRRAQLVRLTHQAFTAGPADRVALFSVTEALDDLGTAYRTGPWRGVPYRARWAAARPHAERAVLHGHWVYAMCAVRTADGRPLLASAGSDGTVRLWDPVTGEPLRTFQVHASEVRAVCAVSGADGRPLLATGHGPDGGPVRLWDLDSGEQVRTLQGHEYWVAALCAVPAEDGRTLLASCGGDRTVRLWDPGTGEQVRTLQGHEYWVAALCAVPAEDGRTLLASCDEDLEGADGDGTVRLWDVASGQQLRIFRGHTRGVGAVCAVPGVDGRTLLASGGDDGTVRLWDAANGEQIRVLRDHESFVTAMCPIPAADGRTLLATVNAGGRTIRLRAPSTGELAGVFREHESPVTTVCTVPGVDGRTLLASGGSDSTIRLWDPAAAERASIFHGHEGRVSAACAAVVGAGGRTVLVTGGGHGDGTIRLWDPATGEQISVLYGSEGWICAVCAVPSQEGQTLIAAGCSDGAVRLWDSASGEQVGVLRGHEAGKTGAHWVSAVCMVWEGDGRPLLVSGGMDGTVRLWDLASGEQVRVLRGHEALDGNPAHVSAVCAVRGADGRTLLASGGIDRTVRLWDLATGDQVGVLRGEWVNAVCAVPSTSGRALLASGDNDGAVRLWDPSTGERSSVLHGHEGGVQALCTVPSAGGRTLLASAGADRTVRLWDPATGASRLTVSTHYQVHGVVMAAGVLCCALSNGVLAITIA